MTDKVVWPNLSADQKALVHEGELILRIQGGEVAVRLASVEQALRLMVANGSPPQALVWGQRVFFLTPDGQYVEGLIFPILGARVIE